MTAPTLTLVDDCSSGTDLPSTSLTPAVPTALICDSSLRYTGLQHVLGGTSFVLTEAVSAAGSGRLQQIVPQPALVIIDATQNTSRVLEMVRQVREHSPEARIVVLAAQFDLGFVRLGHEAGVHGFLLATNAPAVLVKSLELIMAGESVLPLVVLRSIVDRDQPLQDNTAEPKLPDLKACKLSAREAEILGCLREGASNKIIARKLAVTEATVKVHVKAILRKVGAANRTQAAMWASQRLPQRGGASVNG